MYSLLRTAVLRYCTAAEPCLHYCLLQEIIVLFIVFYYVFTLYFIVKACITNSCYNTGTVRIFDFYITYSTCFLHCFLHKS